MGYSRLVVRADPENVTASTPFTSQGRASFSTVDKSNRQAKRMAATKHKVQYQLRSRLENSKDIGRFAE